MTDQTNQQLSARRAQAVPQGPFNVAQVFVERAQGAKLWDVEGNEFVDFCGGIGVVNVGHNHPRVVEAIRKQAEQYIHPGWHVAMYEPYVQLCERLNELDLDGTYGPMVEGADRAQQSRPQGNRVRDSGLPS